MTRLIGPGRPLTAGEWRGLSPGLESALRAAGAAPMIASIAHPGARLAALWRGATPILTRGDTIYWPNAPEDIASAAPPNAMAVLQHELQHVLDYRSGRLTMARYLRDPREWVYHYRLEAISSFEGLGAEQRASVAEHLWLAERGLRTRGEVAVLRRLIPWARTA